MNFKTLSAVVLLATVAFPSNAQDRQFVRTYQSLTLPKGTTDVEVWNTFRTGRKYYYTRLDQRLEFEKGLTDKLQTAFYMNASHVGIGSYSIDSTGAVVDTLGAISHASSFSFSNEWKYKLTDPVANIFGSALYGEYTIAADEIELEAKIILDKKIDKHLFALNLVGEWEFELENDKGEVELEMEAMPVEVDFGYMYLCKPNLGFGLEAKYHSEFEKEHEGGMELEKSALFAGPTFFWSGEKTFLIINVLPQLANLHKEDGNDDSRDLMNYEGMDARILFGLSF